MFYDTIPWTRHLSSADKATIVPEFTEKKAVLETTTGGCNKLAHFVLLQSQPYCSLGLV